MSPLRLILASLVYHWRSNLAVACGVAVGTAVLTGALLVGDSMRGSLRELTLDRLGRIEEVLVSNHFFRAKLADEVAPAKETTAPAILLRVSLENPQPAPPLRANRVELIGCDGRFWQLGSGGPKESPKPHEIVLNRSLADLLSVRPGDAVLVRFQQLGAIPAESALGKKRETVHSQRLVVRKSFPTRDWHALACNRRSNRPATLLCPWNGSSNNSTSPAGRMQSFAPARLDPCGRS